jgi:hypothetical protein
MEKTTSETVIESLSDEEFARTLREQRPDLAPAQIEKTRAIQVDKKPGSNRFLINNKGIPEQFLPYLKTHVLWENRMETRKGFNLVDRARKEAQKALKEQYGRIPQVRVDHLMEVFVNEHQFDFSHEFAVWKEYRHANADGKLDDYHAFVMALRESELQKYGEIHSMARQIRNDVAIRLSILNKIQNKGKHHFIKRLSA